MDSFIKINTEWGVSVIANMAQIATIERSVVTMSNGHELPISDKTYMELLEKVMKH